MGASRSFRPYDGTVNGSVEDSTTVEVDAAVAAATAAAPQLAATPPRRRAVWWYTVAQALVAAQDELAALADAETALGTARLEGEVDRAAGQLRFYSDVAAEGSHLGIAVDSATETTPELRRVHQPLGPVAVFGASNFPFAFGSLGHDTASALAAGCPVIVKAHPAHPLLSVRLVELAQDALAAAGAPDGTISTVHGMAAGVALVQHPQVRAVGFTGSQGGGLALWRAANERDVVVPVFAEMGTVNPVVVTAAGASDPARIAAGYVESFTLGSGQFCTKPGLLLVPSGAGVAAAVADRLARTPAPAPLLTRSIAEAAAGGVADMAAAGARVVARVPGTGAGWAVDTTVLTAPAAALTGGSRLLEECFAPVSVVVEYASSEELDGVLSRLQGCLVGAVMTGGESDPDAPRVVAQLATKAGRVAVDTWPTGVALGWAQHHGGPWPATTSPAHTSVGASALARWVRPVVYQSAPAAWLPDAGRPGNPWGVTRCVDGVREPARRAEVDHPAASGSSAS
ncbi:NADP-dependent aldehyde dehydrogenase [Nocardioides zeae]|uniref:NADP-dependent aldehyde dehydrogenase n=1 Tax=Nocardioides zeae TaxID=1457234 RepID=A0ACC6IE84_9ACTN|nr:aldehyde dehydrogenase family protein [Nocardioides zeae]MDR6174187.1 NADP-dependent aldehyde dehydrogenase [Nocardioides zeae]MDR6208994.1 NADP-dependent aldehyde dehydrogenase [Nocardioides zeae]